MRNTMKKLLSLILVAIMFVTIVPMAYAESNTYKVGDIVQFGSYPQSKVTDSAIISALNSKAPAWDNWTSYGYYRGTGSTGTMVQGDWMRYIDVTYNGNRYRGVKFTQYRPYSTDETSSDSYTRQDDNGYSTYTVYWFKFEPIDWCVLDPATGLVMCKTIIDSQPYSNTIYYNSSVDNLNYSWFNDASYTNYANDYETSSIRQWLNDDFYNTAFSFSQQNIIQSSTLINDGYYTSKGTTGNEALDSNPTNDKIFLLSYDEATNSDYGLANDLARFAQGSDYAQSQGLSVERKMHNVRNNSPWLLRSPDIMSCNCDCVNYYGTPLSSFVSYSYNGVRPALKLDLYSEIFKSEHTCSYNPVVTKQPTHLEKGERTYTCECGDSYTETIAKLADHTYKKAVTAPTCTEKGYTTYLCECGYSYNADYVKENGHSYTSEITTPATHTREGVETFTCHCGDTYAKPVSKIKKHTYTSNVTTESTHLEEGEMTYTCECGDSYTETIAKLTEHTYNDITIDSTCTDRGHKIYTCLCGDSYTETIPAKGHNVVGSACTDCDYDKAATCSCNCHKSGFLSFIWKILCFFYKFFRTNGTCSCGAVHY